MCTKSARLMCTDPASQQPTSTPQCLEACWRLRLQRHRRHSAAGWAFAGPLQCSSCLRRAFHSLGRVHSVRARGIRMHPQSYPGIVHRCRARACPRLVPTGYQTRATSSAAPLARWSRAQQVACGAAGAHIYAREPAAARASVNSHRNLTNDNDSSGPCSGLMQ
jgi:hypothetical protein